MNGFIYHFLTAAAIAEKKYLKFSRLAFIFDTQRIGFYVCQIRLAPTYGQTNTHDVLNSKQTKFTKCNPIRNKTR